MKAQARIVRDPQRRGGSPTVEGTRITVTDIVRYSRMYLPEVLAKLADPPDPGTGWVIPVPEVVKRVREALPHLTNKQVMAALEYWHDHRGEIEQELAEEDATARELRAKHAISS